MKITVEVDEKCLETEIIIITNEVDSKVNDIISKLNEQTVNKIVGFGDDTVLILNDNEIIRVYSSNQKVYAVTKEKEYILKLRLYELENKLDNKKFVRTSNSEIVNINYIKSFDLSFNGTICINLKNGETIFTSRRYVSKIRKLFGL